MLYRVIPARPVMGPEVFQAARRSEKEIRGMKGGLIQEYYRNLVSMIFSLLCLDDGL